MTDPDTRIRVVRATDPARFLATDQTVWFGEVAAAPVDQQLVGVPEEQRFAAVLDGGRDEPASSTYPGIYGVSPMTLLVPGSDAGVRRVPCAGLSWVGVHPDHRRKGALTAMLRHHFEQTRAEGKHVSALHASEPAIYGRHGYGLASLELEVTLSSGTALTAPHLADGADALTTEFLTATAPGMPERLRACHLASGGLGSVVGEVGYYTRLCTELPEEQRGKEPARVLFARRGGEDVGFARFRRTPRWERARPTGELVVHAVVGDPAARLALLRRLVDFDLMGTVKVATVGVDDPLLLWAGGPRATADVATYDSLWVRLVDLPAALQDRAWSAPCDVVVDVADTAAPWNAGTWRIRADSTGEVGVERTTAAADLAVPVAALGAAYLGGGNLVAMQHAGLVAEHRAGAVAELWRAMRTDVAPAAAFGF